MKQALLISALIAVCTSLNAQLPTQIISDTLVIETFEEDPTANMLGIPTGNDPEWVNYDQDGFTGNCVNLNPTPGAWYWEDDFSTDVSVGNSCFTSCSYFHPDPWTDFPCANWLILPPVSIPDSSCLLQWKSLSFQGPAFLDGYQVLISVGSNDVFSNTFKDTLFTAASMVSCPNLTECGSLIVEDYTFTPGYIHANGFTNPDYYFPFSPIQANRGKLEPHQVSLSQYAGKTIYIAFLHDSNNDDILQVDDILVVDQKQPPQGMLQELHAIFRPAPIRQALL